MDRNDVDWQRLLGRVPDALPRRRQPRRRRAPRARSTGTSAQGMHGILVNGTTGEWFSQTPDERKLVAETAIEQVAGRDAGRDRLHVATPRREAVELAPRTRSPPAPTAIDSTAAAVLEDVPRRDRRLLRGHLGRRRRAADGLQLAARDERRHRPPSSRSRLADVDTVVAIKDSHAEPRAVLRDDARASSAGVRVFGPFMSIAGLRVAEGARRRRLHRRRHALRRSRPAVLGGRTGAATTRPPRACASGPRSCSRSSGCPGGWAGQLRRLPEPAEGDHEDARTARRRGAAAAPAGRPTRRACAQIREILVESGLLPERRRRHDDVQGRRPRRRRRRATWTRRRASTAGTSASSDVLFDYTASCRARASRRPRRARRHARERAARRRSGRGGSSSSRCSTATGRRPCRRAGAGARSASARSACTRAASRGCTTRSSPPACGSLMAADGAPTCRRTASRSTSPTSPIPGARSSR